MRTPKLFISGTLVELSSRVESGLPFPPNNISKKLIENILARAQTMYPVTIVAYVMMSNHFHIVIIVKDPGNVPCFIEYFKRETAYCVNMLKGRRKRTVWCDGYDSPIILDAETAINRLKYIYLNPVKAGLIKSHKLWPISSLNISKNSPSLQIEVKRIPRNNIPRLPNKNLTLNEIDHISNSISDDGSDEIFNLKIEPDAWMKCFKETIHRDPVELNELIEKQIKEDEKIILENHKFPIPALQRIQTQSIRKLYAPKKFCRRIICLAKDKLNRVHYLSWFKDYCKTLPRFIKKMKTELIFRTHYPPGFFAPGGFISANLIPEFTPINLIG